MNFHSLYDQGFARVAAVTLPVHPARPFENAREIIDTARELDARGVAVGVYPELCVSGYAIDDLLLQDVLLDTVEKALGSIVEASADLLPLLVVGGDEDLAEGNPHGAAGEFFDAAPRDLDALAGTRGHGDEVALFVELAVVGQV